MKKKLNGADLLSNMANTTNNTNENDNQFWFCVQLLLNAK